MIDRLRSIVGDSRARAAFYEAPLLISWIFGITWEVDSGARRAAGRGLTLFLWFFFLHGLLYLTRGFLEGLFLGLDFEFQLVTSLLQALIALMYLALSIGLAVQELRPWPFPARVMAAIDRFSERFENAISR